METIKISKANGRLKWSGRYNEIYLLAEDGQTTHQVICAKCDGIKFNIEGILKRCRSCGAAYI